MLRSLVGNLFGTPTAVRDAMGTARELLDDAWYTDAEKAENKATERKHAQGFIIEWLQATTGSRLARRVLAIAITGTWLSMKWLSWFFSFLAIWAGKRREQLIESSDLAEAHAVEMTAAVMLILGFYFAAPYMGDIAKSAIQKFGQSNGIQKPQS